MPNIDITRPELVWPGKYDDNGNRVENRGTALPSDLSGYLREEIEHILSRNPDVEVRAQFDKQSLYDDYVLKLGNLTLLEKSLNASISNKKFAEKKATYGKSKILLTRTILEKPQFGQSTKADRVVAKLDSFDQWDSAAIEKRQSMLRQLAHQVWGIPESSRRTSPTSEVSTENAGSLIWTRSQ